MKEIPLSGGENDGFKKMLNYVKDFCKKHPCSLGGAEIVAGAGLIAIGIKTGVIAMGTQVVGVSSSRFNVESLVGAGAGSLGGTAAAIVGNIGIAALGGGVCVPAALLGAVGAGVGMVSGYSTGDLLHKFLNPVLLNPASNILKFIGSGSLLLVGTALIVDGCRRIIGSKTFQKSWSYLKDGVLHLAKTAQKAVCNSADQLVSFLNGDIIVSAPLTVAYGATGAAIGTSVAASSVTVLGSHAIGGLALSLGLVSAPLWPVIALGVTGAAVGLGIGLGARKLTRALL
jgi:hypothetical protein